MCEVRGRPGARTCPARAHLGRASCSRPIGRPLEDAQPCSQARLRHLCFEALPDSAGRAVEPPGPLPHASRTPARPLHTVCACAPVTPAPEAVPGAPRTPDDICYSQILTLVQASLLPPASDSGPTALDPHSSHTRSSLAHPVGEHSTTPNSTGPQTPPHPTHPAGAKAQNSEVAPLADRYPHMLPSTRQGVCPFPAPGHPESHQGKAGNSQAQHLLRRGTVATLLPPGPLPAHRAEVQATRWMGGRRSLQETLNPG